MRARLIVTTAVGIGLLALAGCGSDSAGDQASVTPTTTSTATGAASGGGAADASSILSAVSKASSEAGTAKATITTTGGSQEVVGDGVFAFGGKPKASYTVSLETDGQKQEIGLILIDETIYLKLGDLGQTKGSKAWVKLSTKGTDQLSKSFAALSQSLTDSGDVGAAIKLLQAGASVKDLGSDPVDGVPATKYVITTDVAQALKTATGGSKAGLQKLKDAGVKTVTSTLWVDADNLPIKYEQSSTVKGQTVTTTVRYSDWGKPVTIEAPPASDVGSLQDVLGG